MNTSADNLRNELSASGVPARQTSVLRIHRVAHDGVRSARDDALPFGNANRGRRECVARPYPNKPEYRRVHVIKITLSMLKSARYAASHSRRISCCKACWCDPRRCSGAHRSSRLGSATTDGSVPCLLERALQKRGVRCGVDDHDASSQRHESIRCRSSRIQPVLLAEKLRRSINTTSPSETSRATTASHEFAWQKKLLTRNRPSRSGARFFPARALRSHWQCR